MKTFFKRLLCLILVMATMATAVPPAFAFGGMSTDRISTNGKWEQPYLPTDTNRYKMYRVIDNYAPVKTRCYEDAKIVGHFKSETYIVGEMIKNMWGNEWLRFQDEEGNDRYLYSGWVVEHKIHCWEQTLESPSGKVLVCECGFVTLEFKDNPDANITVDGVEILKQILLGSYSETHSFTAALATMLLGFTPVGVIMDIRDLSACIFDECSATELLIDFVGFIPVIGDVFNANTKRAVKTLDAAGLAKYANNTKKLSKVTYTSDMLIGDTYSALRGIYSGKSRGMRIEIHHAIEKRLGVLFDVDTDDFFSTPLWIVEHDDITKRWRDAIPYDMDYTTLTKTDLVDAVNYVYADNTLLRDHTLNWMHEHWAG